MNISHIRHEIPGLLRKHYIIAVVMLVVVVSGSYFLLTSRAASFVVMSEPEAGKLLTPATVVSNSQASGGGSVQFNGSSPPVTGAKFLGHQPGKIYLGQSSGSQPIAQAETQAGGNVGLHRTFQASLTGQSKIIDDDHANNRLPWVEMSGFGLGAVANGAGWASITSGAHDAQIISFANMYASKSKPILVAFEHEPSNFGGAVYAHDFAPAWVHIYDTMKTATNLKNVVFAPIQGEFLWSQYNKQTPDDYFNAEMFTRLPFLGVDIYQNAGGTDWQTRLGTIRTYLAAHGRSDLLIGIGEAGSTNAFTPSGSQYLNTQLSWAFANTDKIAAISYFNSSANSKPNVYWPLDEPIKGGDSESKLSVYKRFLAQSTHLP